MQWERAEWGQTRGKIFRKIMEGGLEQRAPQLFHCSVMHFRCDALGVGLHSVSWKRRSKTRANLLLCEPLPHESEDFCLPEGEASANSQLVKALAGFLDSSPLFK